MSWLINFSILQKYQGGRLSKLCFLSVVDVDGQQVYTDDNAAVAVYDNDSFCDYILNIELKEQNQK